MSRAHAGVDARAEGTINCAVLTNLLWHGCAEPGARKKEQPGAQELTCCCASARR